METLDPRRPGGWVPDERAATRGAPPTFEHQPWSAWTATPDTQTSPGAAHVADNEYPGSEMVSPQGIFTPPATADEPSLFMPSTLPNEPSLFTPSALPNEPSLFTRVPTDAPSLFPPRVPARGRGADGSSAHRRINPPRRGITQRPAVSWLGWLPSPVELRKRPRLGHGPGRTTRLLLARHRRPLAGCAALVCLWLTIRSAAPAPPATVTLSVAARDLPAGHRLTATDLKSGVWPAAAPLSSTAGRRSPGAGDVLAAPIRAGEPLTDARVIGPGLLAGQPAGTVAMPVRLGDPAASLLVRVGDRVDVLKSATPNWASGSDLADGTTLPDGTTVPGSVASTSRDQGALSSTLAADQVLVLAVPGGTSVGNSADSGAGPNADGADGGSSSGGSGSGLAGLSGGSLDSGSTGGDDGMAGLIVLAVSPSQAARLANAQVSGALTIVVLPTQ